MLISEVYHSRQGEGLLTGTPSVFIRTSGCNLRCQFCDTPFASWQPTGQQMPIPHILATVQQQAKSELPPMNLQFGGKPESNPLVPPEATRHVVLTGGEPLLPKQSVRLCEDLHAAGFHITIETAGTIDRELPCDLMSISPKLSNSDPPTSRAGQWRDQHRRTRHRPDVVRNLIGRHTYQLKFVVDRAEDINEIHQFLTQVGSFDPQRVLLMPEGIDQTSLSAKSEWLTGVCQKNGFRFCQREHIFWYGNRRGT